MSGGHLAWTDAGVAVTGTFMGRDTETGLAYVKTEAPHPLQPARRPAAPTRRGRAGYGYHDHVQGAGGRAEDVRGDHRLMRELADAVLTFVVGSVLIF
jgi:hypothetical protein